MGRRSHSEGSRRAQLQRALGERGEVLPRVMRGNTRYPAQGWYAKVGKDEVFLGDHVGLAFVQIANLNGNGKAK